jgi:uncharacterized protein with HEPN domain
MVERITSPRLADMIQAIERVVTGVPLEAFEFSWEKRWLVERGIEIISEASRHLAEDLKARHPGIPWAKLAGIGNVLRHDTARLRRTCCGNLPSMIWLFYGAFAAKIWPQRFPARKAIEHRTFPRWRISKMSL